MPLAKRSSGPPGGSNNFSNNNIDLQALNPFNKKIISSFNSKDPTTYFSNLARLKFGSFTNVAGNKRPSVATTNHALLT